MGRRYPYLHRRGKVFYFFWRTEVGKRVEESLRTSDPEIASERYAKRLEEIHQGRSPNHLSKWTLDDVARWWLERRRLKISHGSHRSEQSIVRQMVRFFGGLSRLRSLADLERIGEYQHARLGVGITPKTVNNEVSVLMNILREAKLRGRVCEYKPLKTQRSDIPDSLSQEESRRLLGVASRGSAMAVVPYAAVLAWSTGMRSGEIKQLKLGDIHIAGSSAFLNVRRRTTKTDAGARRVALDRTGVWALQKLLHRGAVLGSVKPEHYLLPTDRARHTRQTDSLHGQQGFDPAHPQSSWEWEWRSLQREAKINRRFHDLRHTYVTRAAEAGVPIAIVQAQVGHMSSAMTKWYTHISEGAQVRATKQIEAHDRELTSIVLKSSGHFADPADASHLAAKDQIEEQAFRYERCRVVTRHERRSAVTAGTQANREFYS